MPRKSQVSLGRESISYSSMKDGRPCQLFALSTKRKACTEHCWQQRKSYPTFVAPEYRRNNKVGTLAFGQC